MYIISKLDAEFMRRILFNSVLTSRYRLIILIALNKKQLGTLMEILSIVSGCT